MKITQYYRAYLFTAATGTKYGNLDQGICPVTVYISLIVSALVVCFYSSSPPSWWWWGMVEYPKKAVIRDRGSGTITGWRPRLVPLVKEHDDLFLRINVPCSVHTHKHKQPPTTFPCAICTWVYRGCQQTCWLPEAKPFPMNNNLIKSTHIILGLGESLSEVLK